jgi:hypothetical protein
MFKELTVLNGARLDFPARDVGELVAAARARPGTTNCASPSKCEATGVANRAIRRAKCPHARPLLVLFTLAESLGPKTCAPTPASTMAWCGFRSVSKASTISSPS